MWIVIVNNRKRQRRTLAKSGKIFRISNLPQIPFPVHFHEKKIREKSLINFTNFHGSHLLRRHLAQCRHQTTILKSAVEIVKTRSSWISCSKCTPAKASRTLGAIVPVRGLQSTGRCTTTIFVRGSCPETARECSWSRRCWPWCGRATTSSLWSSRPRGRRSYSDLALTAGRGHPQSSPRRTTSAARTTVWENL